MTVRKIENIIKRAFGQWTPECREAALELAKALASKDCCKKAKEKK